MPFRILIAISCFLCSINLHAQRTHLVVLGSGNPNPDPKHQGPAVAIIVDSQAYLVDFGTGIVRQAAALSTRYNGPFEALNAKNLNIAFLTHLHSDHTIGLPDLILTPWVMGREKALRIFGPEGTKHMVDHILEAYREDIRYRLYSNQPATKNGWKVETEEIHHPGIVYSDSLVTVEAFAVEHGTWPVCFGYRFTTPDRIIVVSGDTKPTPELTYHYRDADVLLHEVYYKAGWDKYDEFWKAYHADNHTSTLELAEIASKVKPAILVTYHNLYWGASDEDILREIKSEYNGKVVIGCDLCIY